jgi:hypothetical protein
MEETLLNSRAVSRVRNQVPQPSSKRTIISLALVTVAVCVGLVVKGPQAKSEAKPRPKVVQNIIKPVQVIKKTVVVEKTVPKVVTQTRTITKVVEVPAKSKSSNPTPAPAPTPKPTPKPTPVPTPTPKTPTTK